MTNNKGADSDWPGALVIIAFLVLIAWVCWLAAGVFS